MTDVTKIAESLGVTIGLNLDNKKPSIEKKEVFFGRKRRAWLDNNEEAFTENTQNKKDNFLSQSIKKDGQSIGLSLSSLRGNPLKTAQYIFELSINEINNTTKALTRTEIIKSLELSKESVRTAVKFLIKNFILERVNFQVGKNGWSTYKLKANIVDELKMAYQTNTIAPLKYNNILLSKNTVSENTPGWDDIDISQLEHVGFKMSHIHQLKTRNSFQVIQESIYHFAYGLKFNPKTKSYGDPLSVLIGVLRKGEAWVEPSYRSTQEISQETINNNIKSQAERLQKLTEEAFDLAFAKWKQNLSEEEIKLVLQDDINEAGMFIPQKVRLKTHFKQNIWPSKKASCLSKASIEE